MAVLPSYSRASFYRSRGGAEIDLVLELPKQLGTWAIEIKSGLRTHPDRGCYHAIEDIKPSRCFVVYAGKDRFKVASNIEAISLREMSVMLRQCAS
jgi:predicted AAA+ superfamily ATPase